MRTAPGGVLIMLLTAAMLGGFGLWQFGNPGIGQQWQGEREHDEEEHIRISRQPGGDSKGAGEIAAAVLARYGGSILELEREYEYGRELFEIKLVDGDGHRRELLVEADGNELMIQGN